jgi:hypothetical protein
VMKITTQLLSKLIRLDWVQHNFLNRDELLFIVTNFVEKFHALIPLFGLFFRGLGKAHHISLIITLVLCVCVCSSPAYAQFLCFVSNKFLPNTNHTLTLGVTYSCLPNVPILPHLPPCSVAWAWEDSIWPPFKTPMLKFQNCAKPSWTQTDVCVGSPNAIISHLTRNGLWWLSHSPT